jgi:streptogramin lyase
MMIAHHANHLCRKGSTPTLAGVTGDLSLVRAAAVAVATLGLVGSAASASSTAPGTAVVLGKVTLGGQPLGVAGTVDAAWVSDFERGTLTRIDRETGALARLRIGRFPGELIHARGALWVTTRAKVLVRVDPARRRVVARIPVGEDSVDVTAGAGSIWVANYRSASVTRVNPRTNRPGRTFRLPIAPGGGVSGIAFAGGYVWAGQTQGASVFRIDPRTNAVREVRTGRLGPAWLAGRGSLLWASNIYDGTVMRLDPVTGKVLVRVEVGRDPVNLELVGDELWVPNDQVDTVTRLDAATGAVLEVLPTAANPAVVGRVDDEAWVSMFDAGEVWRIGLSPGGP